MPKDYRLGGFAGFLAGVFLIPTVWNIGYQHMSVLVALPIVCALGAMFGLWLGRILSASIPVIYQMTKFAVVGVLNTAINFGVLNLLSIVTGVTSGLSAGGINIPATIIAASNSYVWNKLWVFQKIDDKGFFNDVPKFAVVTFIALLVNSLIIIGFTKLDPMFGLNPGAWLNLGKFIATVIGFLVDFLGYKYIVFKSETTPGRF